MQRKNIHRTINLVALSVSVIALPFSVKVCHGAVILFLISWLFDNEWREKWTLLKENFLLQVLIAFFLFHLVGMIYTRNSESGWFDIEKKLFMFLLPFALATSEKFERKEVTIILSLFIGACFIGSIYCLLNASYQLKLLTTGNLMLSDVNYLSATQFKQLNPDGDAGWMLFSYKALSSGINLHPTYFSLYLAFCIVFLLHVISGKEIKRTPYKIVAWGLVGYFSLFIILLSSRIIIISLLILFVIKILYTSFSRKWMTAAAVVLLVGSFSLLIYLNPVTRYRGVQEFVLSSYRVQPDNVYSTSTEIRNSLWWLSWRSLENINLWWGEGTGSASGVIHETSQQFQIKNSLETSDPHSQYIATLLSHGLIGILLLFACLLTPLYFAWRQRDYLILAFVILIAITCLTETAFGLQKGVMFFALFYSLLVFQYRPYRTSKFTIQS